jgi:hypothetical protein
VIIIDEGTQHISIHLIGLRGEVIIRLPLHCLQHLQRDEDEDEEWWEIDERGREIERLMKIERQRVLYENKHLWQ